MNGGFLPSSCHFYGCLRWFPNSGKYETMPGRTEKEVVKVQPETWWISNADKIIFEKHKMVRMEDEILGLSSRITSASQRTNEKEQRDTEGSECPCCVSVTTNLTLGRSVWTMWGQAKSPFLSHYWCPELDNKSICCVIFMYTVKMCLHQGTFWLV